MFVSSISLSEKHVTRATETDTTQGKGEYTTLPDTAQSGTGIILYFR